MLSTFSYGARGKLYRHYVSPPLQQGARSSESGTLRRVSAAKLEAAVRRRLDAIRSDAESAETFGCTTRLIVGPKDVQILIPVTKAPEHNEHLSAGVSIRAGPVMELNRKLDNNPAKHLNWRHIPNEGHPTSVCITCCYP